MRLLAAAAAAMLLATGAQAQNYETPSDSYVCNHGDQAAQATQDACARLRGGGGAPAGPVTAPAPESNDAGFETVGPMAVTPNPSASALGQPSAVAAAPKTAAPAPPPTDVGEAPVNAAPNPAMNASADQGDDEANVSVGGSWFHWITTLGIVAVAFLLFAGMALYFLPSVIAAIRQKRNAFAIFMLNLLLGWSFVGWVVALVWSLSAEPVG